MRLTDIPEPDAGHGPYRHSKRAWEITRAERIDRTTVVLALAGEFGRAAYEPAGQVLRGLEHRGARVVVIDLEQVTIFNIIGLRFLVEAQERADLGGWALVIVAPRDPVYRVIALAGLDDQMNISRHPPRTGHPPRLVPP